MENTFLEQIDHLVENADKIIGLNENGVMTPIPNYTVLITPLIEYVKALEARIKTLENR